MMNTIDFGRRAVKNVRIALDDLEATFSEVEKGLPANGLLLGPPFGAVIDGIESLDLIGGRIKRIRTRLTKALTLVG